MSRPPATNRAPKKDMYWFAHGGIESNSDKCLNQKEGDEENSDSASPTFRSWTDRKGLSDDPKAQNTAVDSCSSSGPSSLEMKDGRHLDKRMAVEERRKQLWEAEQERNDAVLKKHLERDAALEARRNAQRSNIAFAFGSSIPRNVESLAGGDSDKISRLSNTSGLLQKEENHDTLHYRRSVSPPYYSGHWLEVDRSSPRPQSPQSNINSDRKAFSPPSWLVGSGALIGEDIMTKSMTAAVPAPRGRRKNDLMPSVPYERIPAPKAASYSSTRKRSVSMTRLDQLAKPRKHYVEANKASSTVSSGNSSTVKDTVKSPARPLSSASEQSGGSGRLGSSAIRRVRSSPRKPRPVSIAGTIPDHKLEAKISPIKKTFVANKKPVVEVKKAAATNKQSSEKSKSVEKQKSAPRVISTPKPAKQVTSSPTPKPTRQPPQPKTSSPKTPTAKKTVTNKKKADIMVSSQSASEPSSMPPQESSSPPESPPPDSSEADRNNAKRIISEEEARAALAEKRRLAREQAEKEAELERLRQEELRKQEEEHLRLEEEEQKRMEEEQMRLMEEHRQGEEEKLKKAIEENERKEEEERFKREEEQRLKAEQEKKAQEEAEKQRIELEEKLRKEEEERAERKKRLEKIMSRTRGKTTGSSPSGSVSGSDQLDSSENQHENLSSGANSLDSNGPAEIVSGPNSLEGAQEKSEPISDGASMEAHPTYEIASDNESLHDIVMPKSETASQDNSLVILPDMDDFKASVIESLIESSVDDDPPVSEVTQVEAVSNIQSMTSAVVVESMSIESNGNAKNMDKLSEHFQVSVISEMNIDTTEVKPQETVKEDEDVIAKSEATLFDAIPVSSSACSKTDAVDHSEVILSFEDADKAATDCASTLLPDAPSSEQMSIAAAMEQNAHLSTSSDIKLPDPIYENTSDEGSMSSEKQLDNTSFAFQEETQQESHLMTDEVFSEKEAIHSEEVSFNPFDQQNFRPASNPMAAYESQFEVGGMQDSIYAFETSDAPVLDVLEQPREFSEENVYPSRSSTSSVTDANAELNSKANTDFPNFEENMGSVVDAVSLQQTNPFSTGANEMDAFSDKLNYSDSEKLNVQSTDNCALVDYSNIPEQINGKNQSTLDQFSEDFDSSNVTIIKAEGSNDCIGIISSIEHDHISNDLAKQHNIQSEQLKSNFEYSSITDSEDSSLDSNLSQVMTGEANEEKDSVDFMNGSFKSAVTLNNGLAVNPFSEPAVNGNSDSKSNGGHFYSETETLKNGHRLESPTMEQIGDFVQRVDGSHISSVDHSKNNIFDNVDAVSFGKMSPDPFLAKGSSNPISGNPFLLQDDQKQVLMTPDFFN